MNCFPTQKLSDEQKRKNTEDALIRDITDALNFAKDGNYSRAIKELAAGIIRANELADLDADN